MYMRAILVALCAIGALLIQPAFAGGKDETKLVYEEIVGQPGRLGDEFALRYKKGAKGNDGDILDNDVLPNLPEGSVLCAATQTPEGAHFLVYTTSPRLNIYTSYYHFLLKPNGKWKMESIKSGAEAATASKAMFEGVQYFLYTLLPQHLVTKDGPLYEKPMLEALGPTRAYLELLGQKKVLARSR